MPRRSGKGSAIASEAFAQPDQAASTLLIGPLRGVKPEESRTNAVSNQVTFGKSMPRKRISGIVTIPATVSRTIHIPAKVCPEADIEATVEPMDWMSKGFQGVVKRKSSPVGRFGGVSTSENGILCIIEGKAPYYADLFQADPVVRIGAIKSGISPRAVDGLAKNMRTPATAITTMLGLSRSTVARKKTADETPLSTNDSEKVVGLAKLVGQVEVMVRESGNPEGFDAGKWLNTWLNKPIGALNGRKPVEFMDTAEGQGIVSNLLAQIQHGVYA